MSAEMETLISFVLDHIHQAPMRHQVSLYRSLAEFCSDKEDGAKYRALANQILEAERKSAQLNFDWKLRNKPPQHDGHSNHTHN